MSKEVMRQALDALEYVTQNKTLHYTYVDKVHMAINNVREALAEQPAQHQGPYSAPIKELWPVAKPWVGLTDDEIESLDCVYLNWLDYEQVEIKGDKEFARAIEAKLKEKNT